MLSHIETSLRILFSVQMLFWGLNGFFHWITPPPSSATIDHFTEACLRTKFLMPIVKSIEVICGFLMLVNLSVPLCLIFFAPIVMVISLLHLIHNPKSYSVLLPITLPFLVVLFFHIEAFYVLAGF